MLDLSPIDLYITDYTSRQVKSHDFSGSGGNMENYKKLQKQKREAQGLVY